MYHQKIQIEKDVIEVNLCSVCGTCMGICPKKSISVNDRGNNVIVDHNKCIGCNLCAQSCPSIKMIFDYAPKSIASRFDKDIGAYEKFFTGYSCEKGTRENGASGGMVTALCKYLLQEKVVDRVICAGFSEKNGYYRIIQNPSDLNESQKSFYLPIPLNCALREMKGSNLRYAIVGTSCQMQGLVQAMGNTKNFGCKIVVKLGLFCGYIQEKSCIDYLASFLECESQDWEFVGWRYGKYPGGAAFKNKTNNNLKQLSIYDVCSIGVPFFTLNKCFLCPDGTNECSDFAFGDVHAYGKNKNIGIIRNKDMEYYLIDAKEKGYIDYSVENQDLLYENVKMVTGPKRRLVIEQILLRKSDGEKVPRYEGLELSSMNNFVLRPFYKKKARILKRLSSDINREKELKKDPDEILKYGRYIYHYPESSGLYRLICKAAKVIKK